MAVQKSRKTPSRRGMRRAHDALRAKTLSVDPVSGETHLRHHVTADGFTAGVASLRCVGPRRWRKSTIRRADRFASGCPLSTGVCL